MQPRLVDLERPIPVPLPLELPVARVEETAVIGLHVQAIIDRIAVGVRPPGPHPNRVLALGGEQRDTRRHPTDPGKYRIHKGSVR